jgi:hypothetical protein
MQHVDGNRRPLILDPQNHVRDRFAALDRGARRTVIDFLESLIILPPDDTASNLDPGDRTAAGFPQFRHGSIRLTALFNDPTVVEQASHS